MQQPARALEPARAAPALQRVAIAGEASKVFLLYKATTTATFYSGHPAAAAKAIRSRLRAAVRANPWLAGRLVRADPRRRFPVAVEFDAEPDLSDEALGRMLRVAGVSEEPRVWAGMGYDALASAVDPVAVVTTGRDAVRRQAGNPPVFLLTVAPDQKGGGFCLVASMSHAIGDGATYYALLGMLSEGALPAALVLRAPDPSMAERVAGRKWKLGEMVPYIINLASTLFFKPAPKVYALSVDKQKVSRLKAAERGDGDSWVSTNDVVASFLGRASQARVMFLTLNLRGRDPGLKDPTCAGNHIGLLVFGEEDFARPQLIRKTLNSGDASCGPYKRAGGDPPEPMPGALESMSCRILSVTNWCFPGGAELLLPGCEQRLHLPIYSRRHHGTDTGIVFRPTPGETAVLMFTRGTKAEALLDRPDSPLGGPVSPEVVTFDR